MTTIADVATDFEDECMEHGGRSPLEDAIERLCRVVHDAKIWAVEQWAERCRTTPAEWLRYYEPLVTFGEQRGDHVDVRVEPAIRGSKVPVQKVAIWPTVPANWRPY